MTVISLKKRLHGRILDVGGGGEGVIGRLYPRQVVAIDQRHKTSLWMLPAISSAS